MGSLIKSLGKGKISDMRDCNETVKVGIRVRKTCKEDHFIISLNFLEKA